MAQVRRRRASLWARSEELVGERFPAEA